MILLETVRLRLRPLGLADVDAVTAMDADPEVRRYLDLPDAPPREQVEHWLTQLPEQYPPGGRDGFWAMEERATGAFVGWQHLRAFSGSRVGRRHPELHGEGREAELGWRVAPAFWGRGYASEAALALTESCLSRWGERRVVAVALRGNDASIRIMEKCGLTLERAFLYDDRMPAVKYARERG